MYVLFYGNRNCFCNLYQLIKGSSATCLLIALMFNYHTLSAFNIDIVLCTIVLQIQLHVLTVVVGQYMDLDHIIHAVNPTPHCLAVALVVVGIEQTHIIAT